MNININISLYKHCFSKYRRYNIKRHCIYVLHQRLIYLVILHSKTGHGKCLVTRRRPNIRRQRQSIHIGRKRIHRERQIIQKRRQRTKRRRQRTQRRRHIIQRHQAYGNDSTFLRNSWASLFSEHCWNLPVTRINAVMFSWWMVLAHFTWYVHQNPTWKHEHTLFGHHPL